MNKIYITGIGPGDFEHMTFKAIEVLSACDTIIGYKVYIELIRPYFHTKEFIYNGMTKEAERCELCFEKASEGKQVALLAASYADMVICLYNPSSKKRSGYLKKACQLILKYASPDTICGITENIGRDGETYTIYTLKELMDTPVNMFTTVFIGNSQTKVINGKMVTPRGYKTGGEEIG